MDVCVLDLNGPFGPLASYSELIEALEELGVRLTFVVPERRADSVAVRTRGRNVVTYPGARVVSLAMVRAMLSLRPVPDVFHANSTSAVIAAAAAAMFRRRPLVVHLRNSRLSRGERLMLSAVHRGPVPASFVAVSEMAGEVSGLPRTAWQVIEDPVTVPFTRPHRHAGTPPVVGAVANQTPTKGLDVLARTIVDSARLGCRWRVFGSAVNRNANQFVTEQHELLEAAGLVDRVEFCGVVDDLRSHLPELDVMLITSRRESFSRVAAECMLAGVPLIAPDMPGLNETTENGEFITRYQVADSASAVVALNRTVHELRVRTNRAESARWSAARRFSPTVVAGRLLEVYDAALRS